MYAMESGTQEGGTAVIVPEEDDEDVDEDVVEIEELFEDTPMKELEDVEQVVFPYLVEEVLFER